MTTDDMRNDLYALMWSQRTLAAVLGVNERLVRRWAAGQRPIPPAVVDWLRELANQARTLPQWTTADDDTDEAA